MCVIQLKAWPGQSRNWFASSQARLNLSCRNCVTNVWARGLPVFIAVWCLQENYRVLELKKKARVYWATRVLGTALIVRFDKKLHAVLYLGRSRSYNTRLHQLKNIINQLYSSKNSTGCISQVHYVQKKTFVGIYGDLQTYTFLESL